MRNMTEPNTLSLCIIARDEARFLERCLESAKDRVEQIVVVDTGSSDDTLDVARKAGAIVRAAAPPEAEVTEYGRFGTMRVEVAGGALDVAGARSETYGRPGALPTVAPGSLEQDLLRRDFSVNALAMALHAPPRTGPLPVVDPCGGLGDLDDRVSAALEVARNRGAVRAGELVGVLAGTDVKSRSTNALRIERVPEA